MPLVRLHLSIPFSTPLTINAQMGYLDQRIDKAAGWRAENTRYESRLQQESLPRCKTSREYPFPHRSLQNRQTEIFGVFKFATASS